MAISILESVNWPGGGLTAESKKVTGDDRYGYDEAAGTAWVLDGATDLGPYRLMEREESDAAWIAECYNRALMALPPRKGADIMEYFRSVMETVRTEVEKKSSIALEKAEASTHPIASGIWMWKDESSTTIVRLGDCIALTRTPDGKTEVFEHRTSADLESETSKKLNAMTPEEKMAGLREIRATQNLVQKHRLFGIYPQAADNLTIEKRNLPEASHVLIMSDGLWRLVDVYKLMTAEELMDAAIEKGVEYLVREMRKFENQETGDVAIRIKKTDDACGVLVRV